MEKSATQVKGMKLCRKTTHDDTIKGEINGEGATPQAKENCQNSIYMSNIISIYLIFDHFINTLSCSLRLYHVSAKWRFSFKFRSHNILTLEKRSLKKY